MSSAYNLHMNYIKQCGFICGNNFVCKCVYYIKCKDFFYIFLFLNKNNKSINTIGKYNMNILKY